MTSSTEIILLEKLCTNLEKVVSDRAFRADRQSQEFVDMMQALSDSKTFIEKAHVIEKAPTKRKVKVATAK